VWLTAAIGMACGAGLPRLAVAGTAGYLFVVLTYTPLVQRLPRAQSALAHLRLDYVDGRGVLREALMVCSAHGFTVGDLAVVRGDDVDESRGRDQRRDRSEATATRPATVQVNDDGAGRQRGADARLRPDRRRRDRRGQRGRPG